MDGITPRCDREALDNVTIKKDTLCEIVVLIPQYQGSELSGLQLHFPLTEAWMRTEEKATQTN